MLLHLRIFTATYQGTKRISGIANIQFLHNKLANLAATYSQVTQRFKFYLQPLSHTGSLRSRGKLLHDNTQRPLKQPDHGIMRVSSGINRLYEVRSILTRL